jgi:hypothetical protein
VAQSCSPTMNLEGMQDNAIWEIVVAIVGYGSNGCWCGSLVLFGCVKEDWAFIIEGSVMPTQKIFRELSHFTRARGSGLWKGVSGAVGVLICITK